MVLVGAVLFGGCDALAGLFGDEEAPDDLPVLSFYVSGTDKGSNDNDGLSEATPFRTLGKAFEESQASGGLTQIVVLSNLTQADAVVFDGANNEAFAPITIKGEGGEHTITRSTGTNGSVLEITNGAKIKFENITVNGMYNGGGSVFNRAIKIDGAGSEVTLGKGAVITGKLEGFAVGDALKNSQGTDTTLQGSGVSVTGDGKLTITGGEVTGCLGTKSIGAVYARYGGSVLMKDGSIHHNTTYRGGGVAMYLKGNFSMEGGTIHNNTAEGDDNKAAGGGIYVMGGSETLDQNPIYPTFTLGGGKIFSNETKKGAGVYITGRLSEFTIGNGVEISENTATEFGGGIYAIDLVDFTITMEGGTISKNEATNGAGGGVYMEATTKNVSFTMSGGEISGNTAGGNGGGVYVIHSQNNTNTATFTLNGSGVVYGSNGGDKANKATSGKAIYGNATQHQPVTVKIGTTGDEPFEATKAWDVTVNNDYKE
jgi:predicted outer membrane repeat protein